jgi:SAM-dependent methyltransferase
MPGTKTTCETYKLVADYESYPWSFPDGTFDLVVSSMAFHWVNDLPKLLLEIKVSQFNWSPITLNQISNNVLTP